MNNAFATPDPRRVERTRKEIERLNYPDYVTLGFEYDCPEDYYVIRFDGPDGLPRYKRRGAIGKDPQYLNWTIWQRMWFRLTGGEFKDK